MSATAEQIAAQVTEETPGSEEQTGAIPANRDDGDGLGNESSNQFEDLFPNGNTEDEDASEEVAAEDEVDEDEDITPTPKKEDVKPDTTETSTEAAKPAESEESKDEGTAEKPPEPPKEDKSKPAEGEGKTFEEMQAEIEKSQAQVTAAINKANENRGKIIESLATNHYGKLMTEEVIGQLRDEPEKVLPRLLASTYYDAIQGITVSLMQQLPQMMTTAQQNQNMYRMAEDALLGAYPQLKDPKYAGDVSSYARAFHKANPQASLEDRVNFVGMSVYLKHKLPPPQLTKDLPPVAPVERPRSPVPGPGAGKTDIGGGGTPTNQFELLAEQILEDERG